MKIISLWQPWASFVPIGWKKYETRSWGTKYRGTLLIHAAKRTYQIHSHEEVVAQKVCLLSGLNAFDDIALSFIAPPKGFKHTRLPFGEVVAIANLTDCIQMTEEFIKQQSELEIACGDWQVGRYAWKLEDVLPVERGITHKGRQGLMNAPAQLLARLGVVA